MLSLSFFSFSLLAGGKITILANPVFILKNIDNAFQAVSAYCQCFIVKQFLYLALMMQMYAYQG